MADAKRTSKLKRKYYTSSRMRDDARLMLYLRNICQTSEDLSFFLKPDNFDPVIIGTLTASPDMDDEEDLKSPTTALKLGYDIKRVAGVGYQSHNCCTNYSACSMQNGHRLS